MAARDQERLRLGRQPAPPSRVLMACRIPLGLGTCWGCPTSHFLTRFASRVPGYPKSCGVSIRVPQDLITAVMSTKRPVFYSSVRRQQVASAWVMQSLRLLLGRGIEARLGTDGKRRPGTIAFCLGLAHSTSLTHGVTDNDPLPEDWQVSRVIL
jgi:hypothetical protein